ncbi:cysteine desulfurase family protein [Prochlorococcus marinus]|uniref:cysteine desulfurase family protein n=1 Tax=Prochlorococcus marinus TaxID=1219 RepID=UPI0022B4F35D|nr:cysteine desulfurase family protein [Prochlorococcus marinus]
MLVETNNTNYLDACSTSPPHPSVIEEISKTERIYWGNASSIHLEGIKAAEILEQSRFKIGQLFNVSAEQIIFTSNATESIHLALIGKARSIKPGRIVISSVEHPAVKYAAEQLKNEGWQLLYWPVNRNGRIDLSYMEEMLDYPTKIVSLILGQSEIGTIQPIFSIASECKKRNIYIHTDATQVISQGIFNFNDLNINSLSASAHKFRGPKGIGLLIIDNKNIKSFTPILGGGGQESGLRSGTQSVSLVYGMSIALHQINKCSSINSGDFIFESSDISKKTTQLRERINKIEGIVFTGDNINRLPNHISLIILPRNNKVLSANKLVLELSNKGIYISSGTACSSYNNKKSYVLKAIGIEDKLLGSSIRISLGSWNLNLDTIQVANIIDSTITKLFNMDL